MEALRCCFVVFWVGGGGGCSWKLPGLKFQQARHALSLPASRPACRIFPVNTPTTHRPAPTSPAPSSTPPASRLSVLELQVQTKVIPGHKKEEGEMCFRKQLKLYFSTLRLAPPSSISGTDQQDYKRRTQLQPPSPTLPQK